MNGMLKVRKRKVIIVLVCIALAILLFATNAGVIELYYSTTVYPFISNLLRFIIGWIPFSIGDLLYTFVLVYFIWRIIKGTRVIRRKELSVKKIRFHFYRFIVQLLLLYIVFNFLWGLNYDRKDIASQMGLTGDKYTKDELIQINILLAEKVNGCKRNVIAQNMSVPSTKELFKKTHQFYQQVAITYPFLEYRYASIKPSFFGTIGNYLGFSGYYNPFTGEAQVNTTIPDFLQPFVTCHEVGHQLGYAKENEANFAGYITATASGDDVFMYSAYLDIFMYANRNLRRTDSVYAKQVFQALDTAVKNDINLIRTFYKKYENPVEPYINWLYGKYLERNRQPSGILSYSEVVADVIGYYKKYGRVGGK